MQRECLCHDDLDFPSSCNDYEPEMLLRRVNRFFGQSSRLLGSTKAPLISRQLSIQPRRNYDSTSHESQSLSRRRKFIISSVLGAGIAAAGLALYQRVDKSSKEEDLPDRPLANVPFL